MGWFAFLASREEEKRGATAEAASAGIEVVWGRTDEPDFVAAWVERVKGDDAAIALALARMEDRGEGHRVLLEEGAAAIGPWLLSRLHTSDDRYAWDLLFSGVDLGRPLAVYIPDGPNRVKVLASSRYESDRDEAFAAVAKDTGIQRISVSGRALAHGDKRGAAALVEVLDEVVAYHASRGPRAFSGEPFEGEWAENIEVVCFLLAALAKAQIPDTALRLVSLLRTDHAMAVMQALAVQADPDCVVAMRSYRASLLGKPNTTMALRMTADWVLMKCGDPVVLDAAYHVMKTTPERYGFPKLEEDLPGLHATAVRLFHAAGVETEWIAKGVESDFQMLRAAALVASPGRVAYWDASRCAVATDEELWAALDAPRVVWRSNVVTTLAERESDPTRLAAWARAHVEAVPNHYAQYRDDTGDLATSALRVLSNTEGLDLSGTSSAWIRSFVLDEGALTRPDEARPIPPGVTVERFDRLPFMVGHNINAVVPSPSGRLLAVVGENLARVLDAETGATFQQLELRWNWGYDAAWSPDGLQVAVAFHGGHVEIYDVQTGERTHDLQGHGGVPDGVRTVAWSPDGEVLISGGSDGRLIGWDPASGAKRWAIGPVPGSWQHAMFTPEGQVIAAHVKTTGGEENFLCHIDPATGESRREDEKTSSWTVDFRTEDGLMAIAGEGKGIRLVKAGTRRTWRKLGAKEQRKITAVAFAEDGLHAVDESGRWLRYDVDAKTHEVLLEAGTALWSVASGPHGVIAAGKDGRLHRAGPKGLLVSAGRGHTRRVVGMAAFCDGLATVDWDGLVLTWPADGGVGEGFADLEVSAESMVPCAGGLLLGTRKGLRRLGADGTVEARTEERSDDVAVRGEAVAHARGETVAFAKLEGLAPVGEPVDAGTDDVNAMAPLRDGWLCGNEDGQVAWIVDGARRWEAHDHGTDRLRMGNPHCDVASVVATPDGRRFATGATDSVVRVYDMANPPRLRWRIDGNFGLFNRLDFDPTGRLLAIPTSSSVSVWDVERGVEKLRLGYRAFGSEQACTVLFLDESTLMVGCNAGCLFRVRWT